MTELLFAFMLITSRLSGLPMGKELPTMHFLPQDQMCVAIDMCDVGVQVRGYYDFETRVLTLPVEWSLSDPYDLGSLIHEMVHHLQAEKWPKEEDRPCDGEIEKMAYGAEDKFFRSLGLPPDIDALSLLVLTTCDD